MCVQFKVVDFTNVNSFNRGNALHQTAQAAREMVYGCLAFIEMAKGPKVAPCINQK